MLDIDKFIKIQDLEHQITMNYLKIIKYSLKNKNTDDIEKETNMLKKELLQLKVES